MLFPTSAFLIFFLAVAAAMAALDTRFAAKKAVLVVASYFFYAQWDWRFCFLLAFSTAVSYVAGLLIDRASDDRGRRIVLGVAVAVHLSLLGIFKYFDFFVLSANELARSLGFTHELPFLEILLPVGISFFTFHGISYVIDVYRGDVAVCREPLDMALYMSFFPQLVAGPIVRAAYFLPQLARPSTEPIPIAPALLLILLGLFKKVVIANYLATGLVDPVFAAPTDYGGPDLLLGDLWLRGADLLRFQRLYRHRDRAGGIARLPLSAQFQPAVPGRAAARVLAALAHLAVELAARLSVHSRSAATGTDRLKTYRNLMLTMLLGGIWHGAAWKFVMWGALHGGGLAVERMLEPWLGTAAGEPAGAAGLGAGRVPFRVPGLDLLPGRGFHDGLALYRRARRRLERRADAGRAVDGGADRARSGGAVPAGTICSSAPPRRSAGCRSGASARRPASSSRRSTRSAPRGSRRSSISGSEMVALEKELSETAPAAPRPAARPTRSRCRCANAAGRRVRCSR